MILGVVLAAGASRRFGAADKLLADLDGRPLVCHAAGALALSGVDRCAAITADPRVEAALPPGFACRRVAAGGEMAVSFRAAIDLAQDTGADRLLLCLGDMPGVTPGVLRRLLARPGPAACCHGAHRMPPVLLPRDCFDAARQGARGDAGARAFLAGLPAGALLPMDARMAADVDLPGDLAGM